MACFIPGFLLFPSSPSLPLLPFFHVPEHVQDFSSPISSYSCPLLAFDSYSLLFASFGIVFFIKIWQFFKLEFKQKGLK